MKINRYIKYSLRFLFLQSLLTYISIFYFNNFLVSTEYCEFCVDNSYLGQINANLLEDRNRFFSFVPENYINLGYDEIFSIMRHLRGLKPSQKNDFAINQTEVFEKQYSLLKIAIGGTGLFITLLSLVVGGIGIMNVMFVSVKERTREIGVRKAIGATKSMIMVQFLMEAVTICFVAGIIGLTIAYILSLFIGKFFPSTLPLSLSIISIILSIGIGVISGLIPAYKAANLEPIDSLRYE